MIWLALVLLVLLGIGLFGPVHRPRCPECGRHAEREINSGVPVWTCVAEVHTFEGAPCAIGVGLLSMLVGTVLPFTGSVFLACPGRDAYLLALWDWWRWSGCDHEGCE
jgi:hypothetical protein